MSHDFTEHELIELANMRKRTAYFLSAWRAANKARWLLARYGLHFKVSGISAAPEAVTGTGHIFSDFIMGLYHEI